MAAQTKKCAHPSCECQITSADKYCSEFCRTAGAGEMEVGCDCGHPACSAMASQSSD